jgi:hypothetical protein
VSIFKLMALQLSNHLGQRSRARTSLVLSDDDGSSDILPESPGAVACGAAKLRRPGPFDMPAFTHNRMAF